MTHNNHRSSHKVRWRLIPAANDSPVVFLQQQEAWKCQRNQTEFGGWVSVC